MTEISYRILIVDDEPDIRRFLRASLSNHQHEVLEAENGMKALSQVREKIPDLVILDLELPDMHGLEVTQRIREWNQIPIIILSVHNSEREKIDALNAGADDYLTKPFSIGELLTRIQVVMRRIGNMGIKPIYQVGDIQVDCNRHQVFLSGKEIELTPTEFDILKILIQNAGKVVTQRHLILNVWGNAYENESRLLRVNISNLRRKIEPDPNQPFYILTDLGVGYRLNDNQI
ncbi:MAG: response regulator transcription factor [Anaerolineaceae bacterium]